MTTVEHLRKAHGWTQGKLADVSGICARRVHAIEVGGEDGVCRPQTAKALLRALGLAWDERFLVFEQAYPAPRRSWLSPAFLRARRHVELREVPATGSRAQLPCPGEQRRVSR